MTVSRTTVVFPSDLKRRAVALARERKISFNELVRLAVLKAVNEAPAKRRRGKDPLFSDVKVYHGPVPADLSKNHHKYLYDEPEP